VQALLQGLTAPLNLPFSRELWVEDAAALLPGIDVPVLIVIGRRDIQVDWQLDGGPLRRGAESLPDVTFRFPEHANHVLKFEGTERSALNPQAVAARYNAAEASLDPEVVAILREWFLAHR
jgi:hypothetical protein